MSWVNSAGPVRCGSIEFNRQLSFARFVYAKDYVGPPLDPLNLPVDRMQKSFKVDLKHNPQMIHRVFLDYLPGPWGLNVLYGEFPYLERLNAAETLHWLGSRTVGCLAFHVDVLENECPVNGASRLEEVRRRSVDVAMGRLARVGSLELQAGVGETPKFILGGLAAFGGARPKCSFKDHRGGQWLAKFNVDGDPYNCARVEHGTAMLARAAGIDAVQTRCVKVPGANDILFVKRYDHRDSAGGHKVSIFSLLSGEAAPHHSGSDYRLIIGALDRVCRSHVQTRWEMVRRMLFNIAVHNTDDHLKNFEVVLHDAQEGFVLSPAFDVTIDLYPSVRSTSVFGLKEPTLSNEHMKVVSEGINESLSRVLSLRDEIVHSVAQWRGVFKAAGVNERDSKRLSRVLDRVWT